MKPNQIFAVIMICTAVTGYSVAHSPKPSVVKAEVVQVSKPIEVSYPPVEEYIRLTFGVYADKAMLLLRGNGDGSPCSRGENHELDPLAVNDNTTWGGKGRDRGIFQISDYYHPDVTDAMAFDYKQNIDYAWKLFVRSGYSFKLWTCGRHLGI